jgi:probable HAF family extracellular repeat protein
MVALGDLPGSFDHPQSYASDVSANGSAIVGRGSSTAAINAETFLWTPDTGLMPLGDLPDGSFGSYATGVSADGSVIVGAGGSALGTEAYRWTAGSGMVGLGHLSDDVSVIYSEAEAVSANGLVIVGRSVSALGTEAFRWTDASGMVGLGLLPNGDFSLANDVSANGSVVVGKASRNFLNDAFVWTKSDGLRSIAELLIGAGVDLTGWRLDEATAVSANGLIIVGTGINPDGAFEAWRADLTGLITVPEPSGLAMCLCVTTTMLVARSRRRGRSGHCALMDAA